MPKEVVEMSYFCKTAVSLVDTLQTGKCTQSYPEWSVAHSPAAGPLQASVLREGDSQMRGSVVWGDGLSIATSWKGHCPAQPHVVLCR